MKKSPPIFSITSTKSLSSSSSSSLDRISIIENMSLTKTIHDLLNELNQNGSMINECSKKKSLLMKQLQLELDQINELSRIPVLNDYFQLLFRIEKCQQQIEHYELIISDTLTEIYMTKHIIIQMLHIDKHTKLISSKSSNINIYQSSDQIELINDASNTNVKQSDINNNHYNTKDNNISKNNGKIFFKNFIKFLRNAQNKFKNHNNCSLNRINGQIIDDNANNNKNSCYDPYVETIERLKMKLKFLNKKRLSNEKIVRKLTNEYLYWNQELRNYYQNHYDELSKNLNNLDNYFRFRANTNELQAKILSIEQSINDYRQQYRNTMERINMLSDSIHELRNNNNNTNLSLETL